jgi:response regulator of citrate/malate metabolism
MASSHAMTTAMSKSVGVMKTANKAMNINKLQSTMMNFEKESAMMDMKEEMMNDAVDGVMEGSDDELEGEEIMNQVLDEIGIGIATSVSLSLRVALIFVGICCTY